MDEIATSDDFGADVMTAEHAAKIREFRVLLHLNGTALIPELIPIVGTSHHG
jgi:hypothetical protein